MMIAERINFDYAYVVRLDEITYSMGLKNNRTKKYVQKARSANQQTDFLNSTTELYVIET